MIYNVHFLTPHSVDLVSVRISVNTLISATNEHELNIKSAVKEAQGSYALLWHTASPKVF